MRRQAYVLAATLATLSPLCADTSSIRECAASPLHVYFGNGFNTTSGQAWDAVNGTLASPGLKPLVRPAAINKGIDPASLTFCLAYDSKWVDSPGLLTPVKNFTLQLLDAIEQKGLELTPEVLGWLVDLDRAPAWLQDYATKLYTGANYILRSDLQKQKTEYDAQIAAGGKSIVVAHSQGNFYVNEAYDLIEPLSGQFSVVAVATPADHVAGGGPWTTLHNDVIALVPNHLPANLNNDPACSILHPVACHSFTDSYLAGNNSEPKIIGEVLSAMPTNPGSVATSATLDGSPWPSSGVGPVQYTINGPPFSSLVAIFGTGVPATTPNAPSGPYKFNYDGGGPSNSTFLGISPCQITTPASTSCSQSLAPGAILTFTLRFKGNLPVNQPPTITSTAPNNAFVGQQYSYQVLAHDPENAALTYALTTSPLGMTIGTASGLIQWTPTQSQLGSNPVSVRATDPGGLSTTQTFNINVSTTTSAIPRQWPVAEGGNGHWYQLVNQSFLLWPDARTQATGMGGYLATLTSISENAWVTQNVLAAAPANTSVWIGGADFSLGGEWKWVEGPEAGQLFWKSGVGTITFSNWGINEPNNCCAGPEFWLAVNPITGKWLDLFAAPEPFLVEFDHDPSVLICPVGLTDNFNRSDGTVGNGWSNTIGNLNGNLRVGGGKLSTPTADGYAGIYRPLDLSNPVTLSAVLTHANGFGGLLNRYDATFLFGSTTGFGSGYGVNFYRADQTYNNSSVSLVLNGTVLASVPSSFQFGSSIGVTITLMPGGRIMGSVEQLDGGSFPFTFDFGPRSTTFPGANVAINLGFPDSRSTVLTHPTVDNLTITYSCSTSTWSLQNVVFSDGGIATGTFVFDHTNSQILDWNVNVSGGATFNFPVFSYTPSSSSKAIGSDGTDPIFYFYTLDPTRNRAREFRLVFSSPLTLAGGIIPLRIPSSFGNVECYSCSPFRSMLSGSVTH